MWTKFFLRVDASSSDDTTERRRKYYYSNHVRLGQIRIIRYVLLILMWFHVTFNSLRVYQVLWFSNSQSLMVWVVYMTKHDNKYGTCVYHAMKHINQTLDFFVSVCLDVSLMPALFVYRGVCVRWKSRVGVVDVLASMLPCCSSYAYHPVAQNKFRQRHSHDFRVSAKFAWCDPKVDARKFASSGPAR